MISLKIQKLAAPVLAGALMCGLAPAASAQESGLHPASAQEVMKRQAPNHPALSEQLIDATSASVTGDGAPIVHGGDSLFMPASGPTDESTFMSADLTENLRIRTVGAKRSKTEGGVQSTDTATGTTVVSHLTTAGRLQIAAIIESPSEIFALEAKTEDGSAWQVTSDGSLDLTTPSGTVSATIATPWALDARGRRLPTRFTVSGGTITQQIDYTGAAFPVVADPSITWWLATGAKCGLELATVVGPLAAGKIAKVAKNLTTLAGKSKVVATAISRLGGAQNAAVALGKLAVLKVKESRVAKYVKIPSVTLTPAQRTSAAAIWGFISGNIWDFLGFGSCGALLAQA